MSVKDLTGRLARWSLFIQQFDFVIKHRPGIANGNADGLSRRPYFDLVYVDALSATANEIARIKDMQRKDAHLAPLITYLESKTLPDDNNLSRAILQQCDNFFIDEQGLLKHLWTPQGRSRTDTKIQLAVPQSLRYEILKTFHDSPLGGHLGLEKTYDKIRHHYYWSGMFTDIQHWVKSCVDCQMRKTPRNKRNAPLLPIPVEGAFDRVAVDCLGPFPDSYSGNRYVVVFSDYLTRWPEAFAVSAIDAPVIASLLFNEIFCRHGAPKTLLSDRGKNFLSKLLREVCKILNIEKLNTSPYHPATDGLVERFNSHISQSLSMYVSANHKDGDEFLPSTLFAYRTSPQATTGDSPFYLLYGREPRLPIDVNMLPPNVEKLSTSIEEHRARIVTQLEEAQRLAKQNIELTQQQMSKAQYDLKASPHKFEIGQRVWVYTPQTRKGL